MVVAPPCMPRLAILASALAGWTVPGHAATPFDGTWAVIVTCPKAADGAFGYIYHFNAAVVDGVLHGENGTRGMPSWLTLDGRIQSDGSAVLAADGLTGPPQYSVGQVVKLTPYHYRVNARLTTSHGAGTRIETRPCTLDFTRP